MGLEDEESLDTVLSYVMGSGWHIYSVIDAKRAGTSPALQMKVVARFTLAS